MHALAAAAGVAIENARLYEAVRNRQQWIEATRDLTTDFLAATDSDMALARLVDHARGLTGSERVLLAIVERSRSSGREITELTHHQVLRVSARPGRPVEPSGGRHDRRSVRRAARRCASTMSRELGASPSVPRRRPGPAGATAHRVMRHRLASSSPSPANEAAPYDDEMLELAATFSDQAALAMQLARPSSAHP